MFCRIPCVHLVFWGPTKSWPGPEMSCRKERRDGRRLQAQIEPKAPLWLNVNIYLSIYIRVYVHFIPYTYRYIYIHIFLRIAFTYIHTYIHTYTHTHMCIYIYALYIYIYICLCIFRYIYIYICACVTQIYFKAKKRQSIARRASLAALAASDLLLAEGDQSTNLKSSKAGLQRIDIYTHIYIYIYM